LDVGYVVDSRPSSIVPPDGSFPRTTTILEEAGAHVVGPVASAQGAVALLKEGREMIDAAVLDVDLNSERSYPVADALASRNIRFIFATGYGIDAVAEGYRHYPRCQKPFDHQALLKPQKG
jgi:hypothetical protein